MKALACRALVAAGLALASVAASAENCADTNWGTPFYQRCAGSFDGGLDGSADELAALSTLFGGSYEYAGRSSDADFGPFVDNPQVAFNGVLSFDTAVSGSFVLGVVSAGKYSFYSFTTKRRIGGLGFNSLEGVATTPQGNPFPLEYAALFVATTVPEPPAAWLLALGAAALALRRRQR